MYLVQPPLPSEPLLEAPIVGVLRNPLTRHHRLDIDKHPAGGERGEELAPAVLGEHPVRHGEDQPVELGEMLERDELDRKSVV